jgi:hypothetical protein
MIETAVFAQLLEREDVSRLLDHAEQRAIALRIGTKRTRILFGDPVALRAGLDLLFHV